MRNFGTSIRLGYCPSITKFRMASMWAISMVGNLEESNVDVSRKRTIYQKHDKLLQLQYFIRSSK